MITKKILGLLCAVTLSCHVYAESTGVPVDADGDTLPVPVGNIPYFHMPYALAAGNGEFTWDYSGTVGNTNQAFSFQAVLAQFLGNGKLGIGYHSLNFAFYNDGNYFYSNDSYGGEKQIYQALAQSLSWVSSRVSLSNLTVSGTTIMNGDSKWSIKTAGRVPQPPLFKGWVGQPGHKYLVSGSGDTFLWRFNKKTGAHKVAPYHYQFAVTLLDVRGSTMEGMGAGYVGPVLAPMSVQTKPYNTESEIAQPQLKVLSWSVDFTANGPVQTGYNQHYDFSGDKGMLWDDFGPVVQAPVNAEGAHVLSNLIQSVLPEDISQTLGVSSKRIKEVGAKSGGSLYNGNWLPVTFTTGKYKGASIVFNVFWNSAPGSESSQSTAYYDWSRFGWANFLSGLIPGEIDSSTSLLETLYPQTPVIPTYAQAQMAPPPYTVTLDHFESAKYGMAHRWVQKVTITIKPNTALRYALAAYADRVAKSTTADDPNQPITITFNAFSPITQNALFSKNVSQFYEGAAVPMINGQKVGYAWIEHMGGN